MGGQSADMEKRRQKEKASLKPARAAKAVNGAVMKPVSSRSHRERPNATLAILWVEEYVRESFVNWPCDVMSGS